MTLAFWITFFLWIALQLFLIFSLVPFTYLSWSLYFCPLFSSCLSVSLSLTSSSLNLSLYLSLALSLRLAHSLSICWLHFCPLSTCFLLYLLLPLSFCLSPLSICHCLSIPLSFTSKSLPLYQTWKLPPANLQNPLPCSSVTNFLSCG